MKRVAVSALWDGRCDEAPPIADGGSDWILGETDVAFISLCRGILVIRRFFRTRPNKATGDPKVASMKAAQAQNESPTRCRPAVRCVLYSVIRISREAENQWVRRRDVEALRINALESAP